MNFKNQMAFDDSISRTLPYILFSKQATAIELREILKDMWEAGNDNAQFMELQKKLDVTLSQIDSLDVRSKEDILKYENFYKPYHERLSLLEAEVFKRKKHQRTSTVTIPTQTSMQSLVPSSIEGQQPLNEKCECGNKLYRWEKPETSKTGVQTYICYQGNKKGCGRKYREDMRCKDCNRLLSFCGGFGTGFPYCYNCQIKKKNMEIWITCMKCGNEQPFSGHSTTNCKECKETIHATKKNIRLKEKGSEK